MARFNIVSSAGVDMGTFAADSADVALDAMARRAGYLDFAENLVLCESKDGWSLHAPGSTDEEIATGDARYLVSGTGEPTQQDYAAALRRLGVKSP